jgi:hypothetical protein
MCKKVWKIFWYLKCQMNLNAGTVAAGLHAKRCVLHVYHRATVHIDTEYSTK